MLDGYSGGLPDSSLFPEKPNGNPLELLDRSRSIGSLASERYAPHANPFLSRFVASHATQSDICAGADGDLPAVIVAGKNTHVYDAHTYHTKVPPEAIAQKIEQHTRPGDMVLDPFCGSGMTGVACLKTGRVPVLIDLSPAATFIAYNYLTPIETRRYDDAYRRVLASCRDEETRLYGTHCRTCGRLVPMEYMVWSYGLECSHCGREFVLWDAARDERSDVRQSKILTEFDCPHCGRRVLKRGLRRTRLYPVQVGYRCCRSGLRESKASPDEYDLDLIEATRTVDPSLGLWYPTAALPSGLNTRQAIAHGFATVDSLYTGRNLRAVARLWDIARRWPDEAEALKLMFTVTSLYQRVTRLSEFRFWGGSGNIANYNVPMIFNEQNVFKVFARKAKTISAYLSSWQSAPAAPFCISTQSATDLSAIPDATIDYVFTDPPFGGNINYSEMNFLWESWLGVFTHTEPEAIINRTQGKTLESYRQLITQAMKEMWRVLKPGRWLTLVFHNSSAEVWESIQSAISSSGFHIERTQSLDKRHGTFKQFVSENAVGYDLMIDCRKMAGTVALKSDTPVNAAAATEAVKAFALRAMLSRPRDFVVHYLHVKREDELDSRKLYSMWVQERVRAGAPVEMSFEEFRKALDGVSVDRLSPTQPRLLQQMEEYVEGSKTLPAFTDEQYRRAHQMLAIRVATMTGRKLEEGDWPRVYLAAKGLPEQGWSNLNIDVMHEGLGVEHKMLRVRSDKSILEYCGTSLMHPAMTRSIRIPPGDDPTQVAQDVLRQYGELVDQRAELLRKAAGGKPVDMRMGWLLWQDSLREFLYFEEPMLKPIPGDFFARWKESAGGGARKGSRNLWIYHTATGRKRYSVTTDAGAKIQPYFDVPPPNDPHLYYFRVQGEELGDGTVRVWVTLSTALLLRQLLGDLSADAIGQAIHQVLEDQSAGSGAPVTPTEEAAEPIIIAQDAYQKLAARFEGAGVGDEQMMQFVALALLNKRR